MFSNYLQILRLMEHVTGLTMSVCGFSVFQTSNANHCNYKIPNQNLMSF